MSSFVVSDRCIDGIVHALFDNNMTGHVNVTELPDQEVNRSVLGRRLLRMNVAAVAARYGASELKNYPQVDRYQAVIPRNRSLVAAVKAFDCLIYQCCEGHVPEWDLFKGLEWAKMRLCEQIVRGMPEYADTGWE